MTKKGLIILLLATVFSVLLQAETKTYKTTKQAMNDILSSFVALLPYASNEMRFNDPKAEEFIKSHLLKLKTAFKNAKHLKKIKTPGFSPSFEVVTDHLDQTYNNFTMRSKSFARTRLKATAEMCISCHTQLPQGLSNTFSGLNNVNRNEFFNDYEYADYLFVTRRYTQALRYYEREIKQRIEKNEALKAVHNSKNAHYLDFTIENSLKRILTTYTKVFYRPQKALGLIEQYKGMKGIPKTLAGDLESWMADLKSWEKQSFKGTISSEEELKSFISKYLNDEEGENSDVTMLVASGALYRFVNSYPNSKSVPEVLYWLGKIYNHLEHSYFYSLAEVYLKNCIEKYPSSPFARKCYDQYKENLEIGFTGTSGTNIPDEELKILKKLKKSLK
jgi:tetratricopeptide (TPR) repeat protein